MADSTAISLTTGIEPGSPRHVGQVWVLGSAPNSVGQPQNILVTVLSSTCTSRPKAGSNRATTSSYDISASVIPCPPGRDPLGGRAHPPVGRAESRPEPVPGR